MGKHKAAENITTIAGEDGPTSVFMASPRKVTFRQWIQKKRYAIKRKWIERHITADSHSMAEVCEYIKKECGFEECGKETHAYQEEYTQLRYHCLMRFAPELLGEYAKLPEPAGHTDGEVKAYFEELESRQKMVQQIPSEDFDIKLHVYRKKLGDRNDNMHLTVEEKYGLISGGAGGSKSVVKEFEKTYRDIYKYYGVTEWDIRTKSERYKSFVLALTGR